MLNLIKKYKLLQCLFGSFLLLAPLLVSAEDYLDALSAEANATATLRTGKGKKELIDMENLLQTKLPSTYKFYVKLTDPNKQQVLKEHLEIGYKDLSKTSKKVLDLYLVQQK